MAAAQMEPVSVRMTADLVKALRDRADEQGCSFSDVIRDAALLALGLCPTCGRPAADERDGA